MTDSISETAPESEDFEATNEQVAPSKSRLMRLLSHPRTPLAVGAIVLAAMAAVAFNAKSGSGFSLPGVMSPHVVVFDPVKFINAQRAAASILAVSPNADLALTMTQVAKQAELVIKDKANGALVLVKQAVVGADDLPDITNEVLSHFGLPTEVPTVKTGVSQSVDTLESVAPTDSTFSSEKLREDYRMELSNRASRLSAEQARQENQKNILP